MRGKLRPFPFIVISLLIAVVTIAYLIISGGILSSQTSDSFSDLDRIGWIYTEEWGWNPIYHDSRPYVVATTPIPTPTLPPFMTPVPTATPMPTSTPDPSVPSIYTWYAEQDDSATCPRANIYAAQTFEAMFPMLIDSLFLKMYRDADVNYGNITISIRELDVNGHPSGLERSYVTFSSDLIPVGAPGDWVYIDIEDVNVETPFSKFGIVVKANGATSDGKVCLRRNGTSPTYAGGQLEYFNGSSWSSYPGSDLMFAVYRK